jgi:hypothetical protein
VVTGRFLVLALLAVLAVQATGLTTLGPCWTTCPDDDDAGSCTDENCCDCCLQSRVVVDRSVGVLRAPAAGGLLLAGHVFAPLTSDPRDILHVPLTVS